MPRHHAKEEGPVELEIGRIIGRRWRISDKLGEGGCGSVYKVQDIQTMAKAALKAESNFVAGGSVLKLEVQVLKRLEGRPHVAQLLQAAKKTRYSYMVMTLFGHSLNTLMRPLRSSSVSTQVRVGIHILYGLKQLHEVGYVHRDVKPANLVVGRRGQEARIIHILDFGLSREYVMRSGGTTKMRMPRTNTLFRGTVRYCSANTHTRSEQGRPDDLWSMLYVMAEMRGPLPWDRLRGKDEVGKVKFATLDTELFRNSPKEILDIAAHLRTLNYYTRPDYLLIYNKLDTVMKTSNFRHDDPFDWEKDYRTLGSRVKLAFRGASRISGRKGRNEDTYGTEQKSKLALDPTADSELAPTENGGFFSAEDFEKNEIGF